VAQRGFAANGLTDVGQVDNLRPIGNRLAELSEKTTGRFSNRPQEAILPHKLRYVIRLNNIVGPREETKLWQYRL
jgi:hypothetical protein